MYKLQFSYQENKFYLKELEWHHLSILPSYLFSPVHFQNSGESWDTHLFVAYGYILSQNKRVRSPEGKELKWY